MCCNVRDISEFLLPGLIRDVSMTLWKNSSNHFCHSTQVLVKWCADPNLRGSKKATVWCLQFCLLHLTAGNITFLCAALPRGILRQFICFVLFICEISHGQYFSEYYSLMFSRSSFLRSLQQASQTLNALHTNPLNFGSCCVWLCLQDHRKGSGGISQKSDLCKQVSPALRIPVLGESGENTNCWQAFPKGAVVCGVSMCP